MTDIWVCGTCSSINRQRDQRCYKCGTDQSGATGALADTRTRRAVAERTYRPYRSSFPLAVVASAFILAVASLGVIVLLLTIPGIRWFRDEIPNMIGTGEFDTAELLRQVAPAVVPGLARLACSIGAVLFFAAWLSRMVANVPALGGGVPSTSPTRAFIYPLIPIVNLIKVPSIIQDALYRLDPKAGGFFMILLAWVGLVGSAVIDFVVGWWYNLRLASIVRNAETIAQMIDEFAAAVDLQILVSVTTTLMASVGAVILVLVILRIEARARARDGEIRRSAAAVLEPSPPTTATASPAVRPAAVPSAQAVPPSPAPAVADTGPRSSSPAGPTFGAGPRIHITVEADGIQASVDGSPPQPTDLDELRGAAAALAGAGGTARITATADDPAIRDTVGAILDTLRAAGVPTRTA